MASITEILQAKKSTSALESANFVHVHGEIEPSETPGAFRLYKNPNNRSAFLVLQSKDVGDVYEWNDSEVTQRGFAGHKYFTVPVRHGSVMQSVGVRSIIAGTEKTSRQAKQSQSSSLTDSCNYSSACEAQYPDSPCDHNGICDQCCIG